MLVCDSPRAKWPKRGHIQYNEITACVLCSLISNYHPTLALCTCILNFGHAVIIISKCMVNWLIKTSPCYSIDDWLLLPKLGRSIHICISLVVKVFSRDGHCSQWAKIKREACPRLLGFICYLCSLCTKLMILQNPIFIALFHMKVKTQYHRKWANPHSLLQY